MWPLLRRAAATARFKNAARAFHRNSGVRDSILTGNCLRGLQISGHQVSSELFPCGHSEIIFPWIRKISSQPDERGTNSEADGGFSDLDSVALSDDNVEHDEELAGGGDISQDESEVEKIKLDGSLELSTSKRGPIGNKKLQDNNYRPYLFQVVLNAPPHSVATVLDKWIEDGHSVGRNEISLVLFHLRKQRLYRKALQFVEWLEKGKRLNFEKSDYAGHLDLIARVHGIQSAERYIKRVPESFRSEVLYETLLVNCVCTGNYKKAEEIFKEIRDLSLPVTIFACNQMILLYKRVSRRKVANVLMIMEKEKIKPSPFTYKLLIDLKGRSNDIAGMEKVLEEMKASGVEPDIATQAMIARFYIDGGLIQKAEAALQEMEGKDTKELQEMEGKDTKEKRNAMRALLRLYAALGKPEEVGRIWKLCESEPTLEDFLAAIEAWGKLGRIEDAEEVFEIMVKTSRKISSRYYNVMLNVYAENKLLTKGKNLAKKMFIDGCPIGPLTWDVLVKLYVNSGEVEKADSILLKVTQPNQARPLYSSYIFLMKAYAKKGDVHNSEKIFDRLKKIAYPARAPPYALLLEAYVNAKVPVYGFRERMRADNVLPISQVRTNLAFLDTLQREGILQLID